MVRPREYEGTLIMIIYMIDNFVTQRPSKGETQVVKPEKEALEKQNLIMLEICKISVYSEKIYMSQKENIDNSELVKERNKREKIVISNLTLNFNEPICMPPLHSLIRVNICEKAGSMIFSCGNSKISNPLLKPAVAVVFCDLYTLTVR